MFGWRSCAVCLLHLLLPCSIQEMEQMLRLYMEHEAPEGEAELDVGDAVLLHSKKSMTSECV